MEREKLVDWRVYGWSTAFIMFASLAIALGDNHPYTVPQAYFILLGLMSQLAIGYCTLFFIEDMMRKK